MIKYRIAIFASGSGSNAENIVRKLAAQGQIEVGLILSNNPHAFVLARARELGTPVLVFNKQQFYESGEVLGWLKKENITHIVLAGFLWLVPTSLLGAYPNKIINIHPALLPRHGGKGMYGSRVHEAVKAAGDNQTGITIHAVNSRYDEGQVIFQATCPVLPTETSENISEKVQALEYKFYPEVIRDWILKPQASTA